MVAEILYDMKFRSRKFLFAVWVELVATLVLLGVVVAHGFALFVATVLPPPLMPVLWWWASVSTSVLTLYGLTKAIDAKMGGEDK